MPLHGNHHQYPYQFVLNIVENRAIKSRSNPKYLAKYITPTFPNTNMLKSMTIFGEENY
jgi:hypothetical protein